MNDILHKNAQARAHGATLVKVAAHKAALARVEQQQREVQAKQHKEQSKLLRPARGAPVCLARNVRAGRHGPPPRVLALNDDPIFCNRRDCVFRNHDIFRPRRLRAGRGLGGAGRGGAVGPVDSRPRRYPVDQAALAPTRAGFATCSAILGFRNHPAAAAARSPWGGLTFGN
eukprot:COSAG02_NODE_1274_length_13507_cov_8.324060_3_plen_172_part_00